MTKIQNPKLHRGGFIPTPNGAHSKLRSPKATSAPLARGLTLVELLVVVAIIAFLTAVISASFIQIRARSLDSKREAEIKSIVSALSIYNINNLSYPIYQGAITGSDLMSNALIDEKLMPKVPIDPRNDGSCSPAPVQYIYCYSSSDGKTSTIYYFLETDSIPGKAAGLQQISP